MAGTTRPHLRALTGVRFLAALHVVLFHYLHWNAYAPGLARSIAGSGYVAVSLFFVLSGFILSYTYAGTSSGGETLAGKAPVPAPMGAREFYVSRLARIYPVYALGLVLMGPFFLVSHLRTGHVGRMAIEGAAVLALVQSHVPSLAEAWNPPAWSLSTEAFFYLTFPLLAPAILAKGRRFSVGLGWASWLVSLAIGALYMTFVPDGVASADASTAGTWINLLKYDPVVRLPEFIIGICAGRVFLDREAREWFARHGARLSVAAGLVFVAVIVASERLPYVLLHDALLAPLFALLILALAGGKGLVARALGTGTMVALGEASYSLYILHIPVGIWTHKAMALALGAERAGSDGAAIVKVLVATIASLVCYRLVEVPMRARVKAALLPPYRAPVPMTPTMGPGVSNV